MENFQSIEKRRKFLKESVVVVLSLSALPALAKVWKLQRFQQTPNPPLASELVHEFVAAAHVNLAKVKEMLTKDPALVNACWDWGGGDFEVALGGPSHMGNRDIDNYLIDNNARMDIFVQPC